MNSYKKPINIIISVNINYDNFKKSYEENYLNIVDNNLVRNRLNIFQSDKLKKNGTFTRGIYYTVGLNLRYQKIKIQTFLWVKPNNERTYISVFPYFIIKYNKVSVDLIQIIAIKTEENKDILEYIEDSEYLLECEDLLSKSCSRVETAIKNKDCKNKLIQKYKLNMNNYKKHIQVRFKEIYEFIEAASRALAIFLLEKKQDVRKVDSTLSCSERKNQSITHKTDSYDALCVARVLLNKLNTLPKAEPQDIYWTLSMLVGRRDTIVKASTALKNQLHTHISHHYPSYRKFFNVFDCKTALAFWEKYPSPKKLKETSIEELGEFLNKSSSGFFSTYKAEEIFYIVENDGDTYSQLQENRDFMIQTFVRELRHYKEESKNIKEQIKSINSTIGYKLETMIGIDTLTAASFIAEIGDINRFSSSVKLANYAGVAPIKYASGNKEKVYRNRQGNRNLHNLFFKLAARQINCGRNKDKPINGIFYEYYKRKLSEGKTEHQALICVMRRLVNIIYGMMKNKCEYKHSENKI